MYETNTIDVSAKRTMLCTKFTASKHFRNRHINQA